MTFKPFSHIASFALAALMAVLPASGAVAEASSQNPGIFNLLSGKENPSRAERQAERKAEREARRQQKVGGAAVSASDHTAARAEVKAAVAHAVANRPKGRLWCVPFARTVSGVDIRGNAKTWWSQAAGVYARGQKPQVGAVMAFAASRSMPKGHVAVVSQVVSDREILIDQANWERNRVTQDTLVVDVSDKGDWSRVKVANSAGTMGRVNPVSGFIYN